MSDLLFACLWFNGGASHALGLFGTLQECNSGRRVWRRHMHLLCLASDGIRDRTELGRSGEHPVIKHRLHLSHVHGHEELEDSRDAAYAGLRLGFLNPVHVAAVSPAGTVTVGGGAATSRAPTSVTLTGKSCAGAGAACTVNCTAVPSVTGLAPGTMVTSGTGGPETGRMEHPANARTMNEHRAATQPRRGYPGHPWRRRR